MAEAVLSRAQQQIDEYILTVAQGTEPLKVKTRLIFAMWDPGARKLVAY